jgi:hypothetical protein
VEARCRSRGRAAAALAALIVLGAAGCERAEPVRAESTAAAAPAPESEAIPGRWRQLRPERLDPALSPEQRELLARLEALGYAEGSVPAPSRSGVTHHDRARASPGLNFAVSAHAPGAVLMDMDGNVLHRWQLDFLTAFPDYPRQWLARRT